MDAFGLLGLVFIGCILTFLYWEWQAARSMGKAMDDWIMVPVFGLYLLILALIGLYREVLIYIGILALAYRCSPDYKLQKAIKAYKKRQAAANGPDSA